MKAAIGLFLMVTHAVAGELWLAGLDERAELRLVNVYDGPTEVRIEVFDTDGRAVADQALELAAYEGRLFPITEVVGSWTGVGTLRANATAGILVESVTRRGRAETLIQGQALRRGPFLLAHVAQETLQWDTQFLAATGGGFSPVRFTFPDGHDSWELKGPHEMLAIDLEGVWDGDISPGRGWGVVDALDTRLAGWITFSTADEKRAAAVPLSLERSNYLIVPHIPADLATWWAGLALVNTHDSELHVAVRVYSAQDIVQQEFWTIPPSSKRVAELADFFDESIHEHASWIEMEANQSFSGFELFGTLNGETLAGLPLTAELVKTCVFGRVSRGDMWTGMVVLNPGDRRIPLTVEMVSDSGQVRGTRVLDLPPKSKEAFLPEDWFSIGSGSHWIRISSTYGFIAFSLVGDRQQTSLTAAMPFETRHGEIDLAVPRLCVDSTDNLIGRQAAHGDFDADGVDEMVTATQSDLVFLDVDGDRLEQHEVSFSSLEYDNPQDLELGLFVADLDSDGQLELVITSDRLTIFTVDAAFGFSRFQNYEPPIEVDQPVRDVVDINRDGYRDILCNRSLFKSIAGVDDVYWRNTFPYMFQTTGRGSLFLPLDDEFGWDILTVLFDSFYAVVTGNLDPDPDPIYTPVFGRDILEIHKFDFGRDGVEEVISFLGDTAYTAHAQFADVSRFSVTGAENLGQFEVPPHWGISRMTPVPQQSDDRLVLRQEVGSLTRFWWAGPDGLEPKHAQAWQGELFDINGDDVDDFVSPAGCVLGQPSGMMMNPALPIINADASGAEVRAFVDDYDDDQQNEVLTLLKAPGGSYIEVTLWELLGDGSTAHPVHQFGVEAAVIGFAEMRDMDGDNDLDFALAGAGLFVFENTGDGFSASPHVVHSPAVFSVTHGKKADFNNNGILDLVAETPLGGGVLEVILDVYGEEPTVIGLGLYADVTYSDTVDVNDDGWVDILSFDPLRSAVILYNTEGRQFVPMEIGMGVVHFTLNDFTGDGAPDLVGFLISPDQKTPYFRLARNRGDGSFSGLMVIALPEETYYTQLMTTDFNADGKPDLIGFGSSDRSDTQYLDFWENRYQKSIPELPFQRVSRVSLGRSGLAQLLDFDLDGRVDLQIYEPHQLLWFRHRTDYYPDFELTQFAWP